MKDPHGAGARGYVINNSRNITFQDLLLLRSAEWTVHVINSENFTTRNIKIVNRKRQHHDDLYDLTGSSKHILIEDGFAMAMDDTWALYGGRDATTGLEDIVVKGFVNYTYDTGVSDRVWQCRFRQAPALRGRALRQQHGRLRHLDSTYASVLDGTGVSRGPRNRASLLLGTMYGLSTARSKMTAGISTSTAGTRP